MSLTTPLAWQIIGLLMLAALVAVIAFLSMASYARVEIVAGSVTLDKGLANIVPSRPGIIASVEVAEGQSVRAGDLLVRIRAEEDLSGGATAPGRIRNALATQDAEVASQAQLVLAVSEAEQQRLHAQAEGLQAELASLAGQIADQRRLIAVANTDFERVQRIATNGFISRRDVDAREATLISRRQQLAQLEQIRASKASALHEVDKSIAQSSASAQVQLSNARAQRSELAQRSAEADAARGYAVTSPLNGVVTAVTAKTGQPADIQKQLMVIVPAQAKLRVEMLVPTKAAGFVRRGQRVRISVDAFPYQQFGTLSARIISVSAAPVVDREAQPPAPAYLVTAELAQPWVMAFGHRQPLLPGMTLSARIVTEERSLLRWLFEPLYAVRDR